MAGNNYYIESEILIEEDQFEWVIERLKSEGWKEHSRRTDENGEDWVRMTRVIHKNK